MTENRDKMYEFDALGRILKAKGGVAAGAPGRTTAANWTQIYSYDRYGNKTGVTATGVDQNNVSMVPDGLTSVTPEAATNRLNVSTWTYDLAGNLIRGQNVSGTWQKFEYDAAGRLKKVLDDSNNILETYTYGATREKLMVETSTQRTYYAWGGQSIVAEYTEATASSTPEYKKSYIYAGRRLLMTATKASSTTETKEFHHPNRLGTELVTDGGAGTSYRQTTLPFGTPLSAESTGNSNQVFTSYDRSATTGLDYATNRTYSQGQSRFTQVDPLGTGATTVGNPQSNNLYAYTQNMPTDLVDPSGLNANSGSGYYTWTCWVTWTSNADGSNFQITSLNCWNTGFVSTSGGDLGSTRGGYNARLAKGNCRKNLNDLLKVLGKKGSIDDLAEKFFSGTNGKKLLFEEVPGAAASYRDNVIRIAPRSPGEPPNISAQGNGGNFIHELLHAAGGGGLGFSHRNLAEGMYGSGFNGILDQIKADAKAKGLKGQEKDKYIDNALSGKVNAWLGENCPV